ncbi:extensin family protein [Paraburkholderia youngii]|uniref:extensin family protein n=1 Tax=Paraburkholderia youngii TaxID=2782701 RepID=UPI003D1EFA13
MTRERQNFAPNNYVKIHVWQPAALSLYGEAIKRIDHIGSYACRNVNHAADGRLSEHAYAK